MKLLFFDDFKLGVLKDDNVVDITHLVENIEHTHPQQLIAGLIERDLPFYDPMISEDKVNGMNGFAKEIGLLTETVTYDQVVATEFISLWTE